MKEPTYQIEYDDNAELYRCVVIRLKGRHRCGYVSVPPSNPYHGKGYDEEVEVPSTAEVLVNPTDPIGTLLAAAKLASDASASLPISYLAQVHGGITYAGGDEYPVSQPNPWWFGFDAAHCDDIPAQGGRPLSYMIDECHKLRAFLQTMEMPAVERQEVQA